MGVHRWTVLLLLVQWLLCAHVGALWVKQDGPTLTGTVENQRSVPVDASTVVFASVKTSTPNDPASYDIQLTWMKRDGSVVRRRVFEAPFSQVCSALRFHNGSLFMAGHTNGAFLGATPAGYDAFVAKLDAQTGEPAWIRLVDSTTFDTHATLAMCANGDYFVAAKTDNGQSRPQQLWRFAANGVEMWRVSHANDTIVLDSHASGDCSRVYLVGELSVGNLHGTSVGGSDAGVSTRDAWVMAVDGSTGARVWSYVSQKHNQDAFHRMSLVGETVVAVGEAYVAGKGQEMWVAMFAAGSGTWMGQVTMGGSGNEVALDVAEDTRESGRVLVTGLAASTFEGVSAQGSSHVFVAQVNVSGAGAVMWARGFGSSGGDRSTCVAVLADDTAMVFGSTDGVLVSGSNTPAAGQQAMFGAVVRDACTAGSQSMHSTWDASGYGAGPHCKLCAVGTFSDMFGAQTCTACPATLYALHEGATECNFTRTAITSTTYVHVTGNTVLTVESAWQPGMQAVLRNSTVGDYTLACTRVNGTTHRATCVTPPLPHVGTYSLHMDVNGSYPLQAPVVQAYRVHWDRSRQTRNATSIGTLAGFLMYYGTGIVAYDQSQLRCRYDEQEVTGIYQNDGGVWCILPAVDRARLQNVWIAVNGQNWELAGTMYRYNSSFDSLEPKLAVLEQDPAKATLLTLRGRWLANLANPTISMSNSFNKWSAEYVLDGEEYVLQVRLVRQTQSVFNPPLGQVSAITVLVQPAGHSTYNANPNALQVTLYSDPGKPQVLDGVFPENHNATLVLQPEALRAFDDTGEPVYMRLRHGNGGGGGGVEMGPLQGRRVSAVRAEIALPKAVNLTGEWTVSVSMNLQQWSEWQSLFVFGLDKSMPRWAPITGGTQVTVMGRAFRNTGNQLQCQFGQLATVAATFISATQVQCETPVLPVGNHSVTVTCNGGKDAGATEAAWLHVSQEPRVDSVWPTTLPALLPSATNRSSGGRLQVRVRGDGFVATDQLEVMFDTTAVPAWVEDAGATVVCEAPSLSASQVRVGVRLNGQQVYGSHIMDVVAPRVDQVQPTSGPVTGGTQVRIVGSGLLGQGIFRVRMGQQPSLLANASSTQGTEVRVTTPFAAPTPTEVGQVQVQVSSNDGASFVLAGVFTRYATPAWTGISPAAVYRTGGTEVVLVGSYANVPATEMSMRVLDGLGWTANVGVTPVGGGVRVRVPSYTGTASALQLTFANNGQQYVATGMSVRLVSFPTVLRVEPTQVAPGVRVTLRVLGSGFVDTGSVVVRLGSVVLAAQSVTDSEVQVETPSTLARGDYQVSLSLDGGQGYNTSAASTLEVLSQQILCPLNSFVPPSIGTARSTLDCVCRVQFYGQPGQACTACPEGAVCPGLGEPPHAQAGFFQTEDLTFVRCATRAACLGGAKSSCAEGFTGRLCGVCKKGWYKLGEACQACPEAGADAGSVLLLLALFVAYLQWVRRQARGVARVKVTTLVINHLQVLATFASYRLAWPQRVESTLRWLTLANFDLQTVAPECRGWTNEDVFYVVMALPLLVFCGIVVRTILQFLHANLVRIYGERFRQAHPAFCSEPSGSTEVSFALSMARHQLSRLFVEAEVVDQQVLRYVVNEMVLTVTLLYIPLCATVLSVFDCTEIAPGLFVLDKLPDERCWQDTGLQARLMPAASVFAVLYVLGIPLAILAVLMSARSLAARERAAFQEKFSTSFSKFATKFYWYESVVMLRKGMVVAVQLFATSRPALQALLGMVVLMGAAILQLRFDPYQSAAANQLEATLLALSVLVLMLGVVFVTGSDTGAGDAWEWTALIVLVMVLITCVVFVMFELVGAVRARFEESSLDERTRDEFERLMETLEKMVRATRLKSVRQRVIAMRCEEMRACREWVAAQGLEKIQGPREVVVEALEAVDRRWGKRVARWLKVSHEDEPGRRVFLDALGVGVGEGGEGAEIELRSLRGNKA